METDRWGETLRNWIVGATLLILALGFANYAGPGVTSKNIDWWIVAGICAVLGGLCWRAR